MRAEPREHPGPDVAHSALTDGGNPGVPQFRKIYVADFVHRHVRKTQWHPARIVLLLGGNVLLANGVSCFTIPEVQNLKPDLLGGVGAKAPIPTGIRYVFEFVN